MIPLLMKIKIPRQSKHPLTLYLPLFIAWIILIAVFLLLLPIIFIMAIVSWSKGYGRLVLIFIPMVCSIFWHMQGLKIDVQDKDQHIYLSFI